MTKRPLSLTIPGRAAALLVLSLWHALTGSAESATRFVDDFDLVDLRTWKPEYAAPTARDGFAIFRLKAGVPPDNYRSWSKIGYKPRRFTSGRFAVRFALSERPKQAVWWGAALWDDGKDGKFNEINFGYTTDQSFTNSQLYFESARLGKDKLVKIDVGVDLYDGKFHEAVLEYDQNRVALYFDGKPLATITDKEFIPTDPMEFLIGPRLVTGSDPLTSDFIMTVDRTEISETEVPSARTTP